MIHPDTALRFISEEVGHGVVATRAIPRGTITWALDPLDQVLSVRDIAKLPPAMRFDVEHHTFIGRDGQPIMPWDLARFMNHSCAPNCLSTDDGFEIAIRDITVGEELTNDYANLGLWPAERLPCRCGATSCRGLITKSHHAMMANAWQSDIRAALAQAPQVPQPLIDLLTMDQRKKVEAGKERRRQPIQVAFNRA
jgi:uncharacterized protein